MALPDDWWTTNLHEDPCDGCGVSPSKHEGHGSFTCQKCFEARWCPSCNYPLRKDHVCVTPEQHRAHIKKDIKGFLDEHLEDDLMLIMYNTETMDLFTLEIYREVYFEYVQSLDEKIKKLRGE
jgi:hypothetical protein